MLRLQTLANKNLKRTLRAIYAQTQGTPYAATLDPAFDRTQGMLSGANAVTGATSAIMPGAVMVKTVGENVTLAGVDATARSFGLAANFVGGTTDEIGTNNSIGVWRGPGSVYEVLAPVFDDTNLSTDAAAETGAHATEVYLQPNAKGQLAAVSPAAYAIGDTARLMNHLSSNAIIVELLV